MTITSIQAVNLANAFHDVMVMVDRKCAFKLPVDVSPRKALNDYLKACKACGVQMHSDAWLRHAENVVSELTSQRTKAAKQIVSPKPVRLTGIDLSRADHFMINE